MDHAPVLAITGLQHSDLIGTFTQQDVALDKLFIDVAELNERVMSGAHMESVADLAIRTALLSRGVVHITIPVDLQVQEVKKGGRHATPCITLRRFTLILNNPRARLTRGSTRFRSAILRRVVRNWTAY